LFLVDKGGCARVLSHLLHVCFKFVESSIYVEEKKKFELSELQQSILVVKSMENEGHCWYFGLDNYRAYGLLLSILASFTEIESCLLATSIINMLYMAKAIIPSLPREHFFMLSKSTLVNILKV